MGADIGAGGVAYRGRDALIVGAAAMMGVLGKAGAAA